MEAGAYAILAIVVLMRFRDSSFPSAHSISKAPGENCCPVRATLIGQRSWPFLISSFWTNARRISTSFSSVQSCSESFSRTGVEASSADFACSRSTFIFS